MSPNLPELTILGTLGEPCRVQLLGRYGRNCLISSQRAVAPGTVARIRTNHGFFLGEVLSCQGTSQDCRISIRTLSGPGDHTVSELQTARPESLLADLLNLNVHLTACEA